MGKQVDVAVRLNNILNRRKMEQCQQAISGTDIRTVVLPGRQFTVEISFRF
jgi:outer membrane receptor protein involved in Fe transport